MATIGTFTKTKEGGYVGTIRTLTVNVKTKLVPNDNRENDKAPAYRVFAGQAELGAAWPTKSKGEGARDYLSVKLDDPSFPEPIYAALFDDDEGGAQLAWNRAKPRDVS